MGVRLCLSAETMMTTINLVAGLCKLHSGQLRFPFVLQEGPAKETRSLRNQMTMRGANRIPPFLFLVSRSGRFYRLSIFLPRSSNQMVFRWARIFLHDLPSMRSTFTLAAPFFLSNGSFAELWQRRSPFSSTALLFPRTIGKPSHPRRPPGGKLGVILSGCVLSNMAPSMAIGHGIKCAKLTLHTNGLT